MGTMLTFRKLYYSGPLKLTKTAEMLNNDDRNEGVTDGKSVMLSCLEKKSKNDKGKWRWINNFCKLIGYLCTTWWLILLVYHSLYSHLLGLQPPESPGQRLKREGLNAFHPVVLVPGIVTGGLELWEGKPCAEGLFRERLWGDSFTDIFKRPKCWLEHLSLDNETGLDLPGIRVRAVQGLIAADNSGPGYFVGAVLIQNLAKIGYDERNLHMAAYDWRLSFQNTEKRDLALTRLKNKIELLYVTNGNKKVVVVPHSMGAIYFLHFLKWVESPPPMGGGGGPGWCAKHIKAIMNIAPAFLGVPKTVANILSAEDKGVALLRAMAPGIFGSRLFKLQTLEHAMRVSRTWDSMISLFPKGGETIWGDLDSTPEKDQKCDFIKKRVFRSGLSDSDANISVDSRITLKEGVKYGRIISFGKMASDLHSSQLPTMSFKDFVPKSSFLKSNTTCVNLLTEYDEVSREILSNVSKHKAYTAETVLDLVRSVAPKMMQRAEMHFSHAIADDLDDSKYAHYKYWSNPLETRLPDAPDMEIYSLYGVGIPTERSYIYKRSPSDQCRTIPFRIDRSANDRSPYGCLKGGVYYSDGDESVPLISSGFMCARGWRGKTRFNPSGSPTYVREYRDKPPSGLLEGRGSESGAHVDIMGNVALIEDVLRVAAGATGEELGGDRIFSDIMRMSKSIELKL